MRLLVGALKADSGQAEVCGYDIERQTEQARAQFGYLSQRFSMYEDLSVKYPLLRRGAWIEIR